MSELANNEVIFFASFLPIFYILYEKIINKTPYYIFLRYTLCMKNRGVNVMQDVF